MALDIKELTFQLMAAGASAEAVQSLPRRIEQFMKNGEVTNFYFQSADYEVASRDLIMMYPKNINDGTPMYMKWVLVWNDSVGTWIWDDYLDHYNPDYFDNLREEWMKYEEVPGKVLAAGGVVGKDWIIERQEGIYRPWIYGDFDWRALPFIKDDDIDHMGIERVDEAPNMGRVFQSTRPQMKIGAADTVRKNFMLTKQGRAVLVVPAQFLKILGWQQGTFVKTSVISSGEIRISPDEISTDRGRTLVLQGSSTALIYPESLIVSIGIDPESPVNMWIENGGLHVSGHKEVEQTVQSPVASTTTTVEGLNEVTREGLQESVKFKDLGYELLDGGFSPEEADSLLAFIESKNNILKMDPDCEFDVQYPYVHVSIATIPRVYTIFNDNGRWKMVFTKSIQDFGIKRVDEVKRNQVAKELLMNGSDPNSLPDLQRLFDQWDDIHRKDATDDEFALIMNREYEVRTNEFSYVTDMGFTYAYEWDPKLEQWFWADDKAARDFKIRRVDEIKWQKLPGEMLAAGVIDPQKASYLMRDLQAWANSENAHINHHDFEFRDDGKFTWTDDLGTWFSAFDPNTVQWTVSTDEDAPDVEDFGIEREE